MLASRAKLLPEWGVHLNVVFKRPQRIGTGREASLGSSVLRASQQLTDIDNCVCAPLPYSVALPTDSWNLVLLRLRERPPESFVQLESF